MANKKFNTDVEILGSVTTQGVIAEGGGSATELFLTDGTKKEVDSWSTLDW